MRQKFLLIISSKGFEYIENSSDLSNRISYVLYKETLLFNIHYKAEADMDTFIKSIIDIIKTKRGYKRVVIVGDFNFDSKDKYNMFIKKLIDLCPELILYSLKTGLADYNDAIITFTSKS